MVRETCGGGIQTTKQPTNVGSLPFGRLVGSVIYCSRHLSGGTQFTQGASNNVLRGHYNRYNHKQNLN